MKKILSIVTTSVMTIVLASGCGASPETGGDTSLEMHAQIDRHDEATNKSAIYVGHVDTEKIMKTIKIAAQKDGWKVTEFKSNALIVEKIVDGEAMSSTIQYHNDHVYGNNDHASMDTLLELRDSIVTEIKENLKIH